MLVLYFDGGSRGNPGPSGCGAVLFDVTDTEASPQVVWERWHFMDFATNNVAEYGGLILGLEYMASLDPSMPRPHLIQGDSKLVIKQVQGTFRTLNAGLIPLRDRARSLMAALSIPVETMQHVPRDRNRRADWLANHAMDTRGSSEP